MASKKKAVLHVGCGAAAPGKLHHFFDPSDWHEVRLDIDPDVRPDVVASITDMGWVRSAQFDAVFSSHNLEHLYPHEVPVALREFRRVLKPDGFALVTTPDIQAVAQLVAHGGLNELAYQSPLGPITPLDMLYGYGPALTGNNLYMAHHTGFTGQSMLNALTDAGFAFAVAQRHPEAFALWAIGFATPPNDEESLTAQQCMFPMHIALRQRQLDARVPMN